MMKMKKFLMLLTVAAIALMCFTGCGSAKITGITLDDITLEKGESVTLNAEFVADKADIDAETLNKAIEKLGVTFTVADESIAALDGTTLIALAAGETTVTVSSADGALSATAKVVVQAVVEGIEAEDILLNTADEIAAVEYTLLPEGAKAEKMEFAVADESVVTVKDGDLVVVAAGETELTITADGVEKTVTVTVQQAPEKLTVEDMELEVGATADIIVDTGLEDVEAEVGTEYTYTSADENTATVDENGVVTGVAAGETTITVENELGQKTDCKVVVTEPVRQTTSRPAGNNGGNGNTGNGSNTGAETAAVLRLRRLPTRLRLRSPILRRHLIPLPMCRLQVVTMKLGEMVARLEKMAARLSPAVGRMRGMVVTPLRTMAIIVVGYKGL